MIFYTMMRNLRKVGLGAVAVAAMAGPVQSEELLAARLGSILGQERQAIGMVSDTRLAALTAPPPASARNIPTAPGTITYDVEFLNALPAASGGEEWRCLANALYFEARGESVRGMFAVGEVILNRVESGRFPDTICGVVYQGTGQRYQCQFTFTCDGNPETIREQAAFATVGKVARVLLDGASRPLTEGATHYHTRAVNPRWARVFPRTTTIGSHHFYRQG